MIDSNDVSKAQEYDGPENSQTSAFFDAVQRAVEDKGLERVSQDDIIRYSGIPRTTLYRRYGSREAILNAFVLDRTAPDIAECRRIATGAGSFSERFEDILVFAILAAHRHSWLQRQLDRGTLGNVEDILARAFQLSSEQTLIPFLIEAKKQGICHCPAPIEELRHWLMIQIFNLSRRQYASAGEARRVVRTYVLPVLALEQPTPAISEKIDFIYRYIQDCLPR
jgi:AcrR family transcriptional regulator